MDKDRLREIALELMDADREKSILAGVPKFKESDLVAPENYDNNDDFLLGTGEYGNVIRARIRDGPNLNEIAVKRLKDLDKKYCARSGVIEEIGIMRRLRGCPNVVSLVGIIDPLVRPEIPWILMECCSRRDLRSFFVVNGFDEIDKSILLVLTKDLAAGMTYVSDKKGIVHADLHTGNCFLTQDMRLKIGDFGFSFRLTREERRRDLEIILSGDIGSKGRPKDIPLIFIEGIRWRPPEFIPGPDYGAVVTRAGDVWGFGIILFELWTRARPIRDPFDELSDEETMRHIFLGNIPTAFEVSSHLVPEPILKLMKRCWSYAPIERPNFTEILELASKMDESSFCKESLLN